MGFDIETITLLLDKPSYIFVILGMYYVIRTFKKTEKIDDISEKVNKYEIQIEYLKKDMTDLKNKHERLDNEHRNCTKPGGKHN